MMNSALLRTGTIGDGIQESVNEFPKTLRTKQNRLLQFCAFLKREQQSAISIRSAASKTTQNTNYPLMLEIEKPARLRKWRDRIPEFAKFRNRQQQRVPPSWTMVPDSEPCLKRAS